MQREMKPTKINREKLIGRNMGSLVVDGHSREMSEKYV
jgi:hypothetical protein